MKKNLIILPIKNGLKNCIVITRYNKYIFQFLFLLFMVQPFICAQTNNALSFDGTDDYVSFGSLNPSVMTVEAWVKPAGFGDMAVVSTLNGSTLVGYELHLYPGGNVYVTLGHGGTCLDIRFSSTITAGQWTHLAFSYDGTTCKVYINGSLSSSGSFTSYNAGTEAMKIGYRSAPGVTTPLYYSGAIDDVIIWSSVRTAAEISSDMLGNVTGSETGISAYYNFNQGTAGATNTGTTSLTDSSPIGLNGTLNNFELTGAASNWVLGPELPSLKTLGYLNVSNTSVTIYGKVTSLGSFSPVTRGICFNTSGSPVVSDNHADAGSVSFTGILSSELTGLIPNTTYHIRAYATNLLGTGYGEELTFTTLQDAPVISYSSSSYSYPEGTAISSLVPTNTGGEVPATIPCNVTTFAGTGSSGSVDATGTSASFNSPLDVETDNKGNVYVAAQLDYKIRKITPAGEVTSLAGAGTFGYADGTGSEAKFNTIGGISVDFYGNVYVADVFYQNIRKITSSGVVTTIAGNTKLYGTFFGYKDGLDTAARFSSPYDVESDVFGNLYVLDAINCRIRMISPELVVTTFAGSGYPGSVDGSGTGAKFNSTKGITRSPSGDMYIADKSANTIRKMTTEALVTTIAGSGTGEWADGDALTAGFYGPCDVATDAIGNIYVADNLNKRIRKISVSGIVSTIAGNGTSGFTNGIGTAATFKSPRGIAADNFGNLFVADYENHSIRKITLFGYTINPALPAGLNFDATTGTISGTPTEASPLTSYTITTANNGGESTTTINIEVSTTTDIDDNKQKILSKSRIYPNPCQDMLTVETGIDNCIYTICDITGVNVANGNLKGDITVIDISFLNTGIYILNISSGNIVKKLRLIKI